MTALHALTGTRTQPLSDSSGIIGGFLATWKSLVAWWIQMTNGARYFLTNSCGIFVTVDQEGVVDQEGFSKVSRSTWCKIRLSIVESMPKFVIYSDWRVRLTSSSALNALAEAIPGDPSLAIPKLNWTHFFSLQFLQRCLRLIQLGRRHWCPFCCGLGLSEWIWISQVPSTECFQRFQSDLSIYI